MSGLALVGHLALVAVGVGFVILGVALLTDLRGSARRFEATQTDRIAEWRHVSPSVMGALMGTVGLIILALGVASAV